MVDNIFMHVLPFGEPRVVCHPCGVEEEDSRTMFCPLDPKDKALEIPRASLEAEIKKRRSVHVLDVCAYKSQNALCMQDIAIPLNYTRGSVSETLILLARMKSETRQVEVSEAEAVFRSRGFVCESPSKDVQIEGGDIVAVDQRLFVGLGGRTNLNGVSWLKSFAEPMGYQVFPVIMKDGDYPHLTTMFTWAGKNREGKNVVVRNPEFVPNLPFNHDDLVVVDIDPRSDREKWAANVLPIRGDLLIQANSGDLSRKLRDVGVERLVELDWEPMKNGKIGLTCCCLILNPQLVAAA